MININLLPKKPPFERWYSAIWLNLLLIGVLVSLFSYGLYQTSGIKQIELQNTLALLKSKELIYTEMAENKRYISTWLQLKEEAALLQQESVDWIPLFQTLYRYLPEQGTIASADYNQGKLRLKVILDSRVDVAAYEQFLRSSELFTDVFVNNIASNEPNREVIAQFEAVLHSSFYKGGEDQ
jgi:Tfp pilus assembly protein PilN